MLAGRRIDVANQLRDNIDLLPAFIEEVVRLESPLGALPPIVLADTTLGGVDLPAGSHLLLLWDQPIVTPRLSTRQMSCVWIGRAASRTFGFGRGDHF